MSKAAKPATDELAHDRQLLLASWVDLPPVAQQMVSYLLDQIIALEQQGEGEIAIAMLEDIHLRLVTGKTSRLHH